MNEITAAFEGLMSNVVISFPFILTDTGSNTKYTCTTRGEGTLTFTWSMTTPVSLSSSVQTQFNPQHGRETSSQANHDGVYMCSAGNDTESVDPRQATLTVIG